jgi:DNA-binding MarR family transcriptional regulator
MGAAYPTLPSTASPGADNPALDRLEKLGLVKRGRTAVDRRVVRIELTTRGHRLANRLRDAHIENCRAMLARLDPEQREEFLRLAAQMAEK